MDCDKNRRLGAYYTLPYVYEAPKARRSAFQIPSPKTDHSEFQLSAFPRVLDSGPWKILEGPLSSTFRHPLEKMATCGARMEYLGSVKMCQTNITVPITPGVHL